MAAARLGPNEAMISNQWLHIWTTLASIKSVQKAKTQEASVSWRVLRFIIDSTKAGQYANYDANPVPFGDAPHGHGERRIIVPELAGTAEAASLVQFAISVIA